MVFRRYVNALPTISDANWSAVFAHAHRSDNVTVTASFLRHEPILSMFVMPFPLVCSVVAVVSCSRSDHIMVRCCIQQATCLLHLKNGR